MHSCSWPVRGQSAVGVISGSVVGTLIGVAVVVGAVFAVLFSVKRKSSRGTCQFSEDASLWGLG